MTLGLDPDCHYGDHTWLGGSICVRCDKRLRCMCGQFMREDSIEAHLKVCRIYANMPEGDE